MESTTERASTNKSSRWVVVFAALILAGVGMYVILSGKDKGVSPSSSSTRAPEKAVCENLVCEEGETFALCPTDCIAPSSAELAMATLALSVADLPSFPPKKPEESAEKQWDTTTSQLVDENNLSLGLGRGQGMLVAWQSAFISAEYYRGSGKAVNPGFGRVSQDIIVFPKNKIRKAFDSVSAEGISTQFQMNVQELQNPNVGEMSKALKLPFSGSGDVYVLVFVKKNYMEIITLGGSGFEYNVLPSIARKAADKIK